MSDNAWPQIGVLGAGGVGCYFGGVLARAGAPVTLVGRQAHIDAIVRDGLYIDSPNFREHIRVRATTGLEVLRDSGVVLVCVKSTDSESAARALQPHLGASARVVSMQNGVDNAARIASILARPVLAAVVYVGVVMTGPGQVRHTGRGDLVVGPLREHAVADPSLMASASGIAAMFERGDVPCKVSTHVEAVLWEKLTLNCVYNAISALGCANYGRVAQTPSVHALLPDIVSEVVAVAHADGVELDRDRLVAGSYALAQSMSTQISSTAQDIQRGKRTEIDALNGFIARRGDALGVPVPINRTLHALVKLREDAPEALPR